MPKADHKSTDSDVFSKGKSVNSCPKSCCIEECNCLTAENIICMFKDSIVEIHSEFVLLGEINGVPVTSATGGTPLYPGYRSDIILEGNGFFIKGHYIVAPSHLVLLPPSLTSVVNRFPLFDPNDTTLGEIKNQMIRPSRILVSIFNVNGLGTSYVYEADLVGVDGAGDIAVLFINPNKAWNFSNPCIEKHHPFLSFGESRSAKEGEKVYLIGDYISASQDQHRFNAVGAVSEGLLSDHRYLEYSGWVLPELVLVSASAYAFSSGLPIINCQGKVIGMQTTDLSSVLPTIVFPSGEITVIGNANLPITAGYAVGGFSATGSIPSIPLNQQQGHGLVAGPSEFFMRRVVKTIIKGTCNRKSSCQLESICDPVGAYYRYKKSYLGIAYDVFTGIDYDITVDYTSGSVVAGQPRIRLTADGDFINLPLCKELIGIRVLGVAGLNPNDALGVPNGQYYVPGGTSVSVLPNLLPISPLLGKLYPGDIITHINGIGLGDLQKQVSPSLITWRLCASDKIEITYRRGGNVSNSEDNGVVDSYQNLFTTDICLADFPYILDYPWYAVNHFPLLHNLGFIFPLGQMTNPQLPALQDFAPFHPAL